MKKKPTSTDNFLAGALLISLLASILHPILPTVLCSAIHLAVTTWASILHCKKAKTSSGTEVVPEEVR